MRLLRLRVSISLFSATVLSLTVIMFWIYRWAKFPSVTTTKLVDSERDRPGELIGLVCCLMNVNVNAFILTSSSFRSVPDFSQKPD